MKDKKEICSYVPKETIYLNQELRFNKKLTWGEKVFLAEIKSLCDDNFCPYCPNQLAKTFGVSRVSVNSWIKKLCALGFIEINRVNDSDSKFTLKIIK